MSRKDREKEAREQLIENSSSSASSVGIQFLYAVFAAPIPSSVMTQMQRAMRASMKLHGLGETPG